MLNKLYIIIILSQISINIETNYFKSKNLFVTDKDKPLEDTEIIQQSYVNCTKHSSLKLPLKSFQGGQFYTSIEIGFPTQPFDVILDTGSGNLWVPDQDCANCSSQRKLDFESTKSQRQSNYSFDIEYATGKIEGSIASDRLTLTDENGVKWIVQNQIMGSVEKEIGAVFRGLPFQGIMGIGKHSLTLNGHRNVLENLIHNNCLKKNLISFDLNDDSSSVEFGDYSLENIESKKINWQNNESEDQHEIQIDQIRINGIRQDPVSKKVAVDTGTSNISGPSEDIPRMNQFLGSHCDEFNSFEGAGDNARVEFVIQGLSYPLDIPKNQRCSVDINVIDVDPPRGPMWIFGNEFIKLQYTVFDIENNKIGFGKKIISQ